MSHLRSNIPKFIVAPLGVAEAGKHIYDLPEYTLALIDDETNLTVDAIDRKPGKRYRLAYVTGNKGMDNKQFGDLYGASYPKYIDFSRIIDKPIFFDETKDAKPFVATLGYDGINPCKGLSFECGKTYGIQVKVSGQAVRDDFNRHLEETFTFSTGCCDDCSLEESITRTLDTIIKEAKNQLYYTKNYFNLEKLLSCCPEPKPFDRKLFKEWTITICDNGTVADLSKLKRQYPGYDIERISRVGIDSTYQVCLPENEVPEDYVMKTHGKLKCGECPNCPGDFTFVEGGDKYIVCFDTASAAGVSTLEEFTFDYYTDDTTAQDTINALVEAAGALIPDYVPGTASIIEANCEKLTLQLCVVEGTDLTEHGLADITTGVSIGKCLPKCEGEKTFSWCEGDEKYKITRTKCITFKKDDCTEGQEYSVKDQFFIDLQADLATYPTVDETTLTITGQNDCLISLEVEQCNNECLEDGCDTDGRDWATFDRIPNYKGAIWNDCPCEGWEFDPDTGCPIQNTEVTVDNCIGGLKFTTKIVEPQVASKCTFDIDDQILREPTRLEVALIDRSDSTVGCDVPEVAWTVLQQGTPGEGYGQFAFKDLVLSAKYEGGLYYSARDAMGSLLMEKLGYEYNIDPNKKYKSVSFRFSERNQIDYIDDMQARIHLAKLYVEESDTELFEEIKDFVNKLYNTTALYH